MVKPVQNYHFINPFKLKIKMKKNAFFTMVFAVLTLFACDKSALNLEPSTTSTANSQQNTNTNSSGNTTTTNTNTTTNTSTVDISVLKAKFGSNVTVSVDGDYLVIKSNGVPDHKSPYFKGTTWESSLYEAYNGTAKFSQNPNVIKSQNLTFRIPLKPKEATSKTATSLGPIGVAINGVPFFNQYAAMNAPLTNEIFSFDQYNGHPQQQGQYHYHVEPTAITKAKGKTAFLGLLLDGFPVYGPTENGKTVSNTDLDKYHGHIHATTEFPNGIYHYHVTDADPYINGSGYFGVKGTVTQ